MKKYILKSAFLLTIIGGLSVACNIEPVPQPDTDKTVAGLELNASLPDVQTKTSLGSEPDYNVLWSKGDQISVNGILSNAVTEEDHGKTQVRFRVDGNLTAPYKVLYPGTDKTNVITLPATQNYVAGSYDSAAYAAYGTVVELNGEHTTTLNNFCGLVRFELTGSATLSKIEVNTLGEEKLHGAFSLADSFDGVFTGGSEGTLTYSFGDGLTLSKEGTHVYIALPAQTYSAGVEAKVYQADGAFMRLKFWGEGFVLKGDHIRAFESKTYAAGRVEELVGIDKLDGEDYGMPDIPAGVTVALFNTLRFDEEYRPSAAITRIDRANAFWRPEGAIASDNVAMRDAFGKVIYNTRADIIGFTEVDDNMNDYTDLNSIEKLAESQGCNYAYEFFSSSQGGWFSSGDLNFANGFAYNEDVLDLNDSGRAWYNSSGTTNYSTSSDDKSGSPKRTYVWAKFTHKASGKQFYFFVTHLPHGEEENTKAANGINNFARSKAGSLPHILVGDMNNADVESHECYEGSQKLLEYWTDVYRSLNDSGKLLPFYQKYCGTQSGTGTNYHYTILDFCKNHPERRIGKIMTKGDCTATTYKTIRNTYTVHYKGQGIFLEKQVVKDENGDVVKDEDGNDKTVVVEKIEDVDEDVPCYPSDHLALVSYITLD